MGLQVCGGATLMCMFGTAPTTLVVIRPNNLSGPGGAANIMDKNPLVNVPPFGACTSLGNPSVAAATAAALGVLTPMPCIPATVSPWMPGKPNVLVAGMPALDSMSKLICMWGGVIQVTVPGQLKEVL